MRQSRKAGLTDRFDWSFRIKLHNNGNREKVIRIYNERIVKTDKGFYELMSYFDTNSNIIALPFYYYV